LRQELKHVAGSRSAAAVKAPLEAQVTDAERLLIRALASASQMTPETGHVSGREGVEEAFDPAAQAHFALRAEQLHRGLATESLIEVLLSTESESGDVMQLQFSDGDRRLLAAILMKEDEELSPERLEGAVKALRRIALKRKLEQVQRELQGIRGRDTGQIEALLQEKVRIKRALMDAGLVEQSPA
jgi:hypothetical protein